MSRRALLIFGAMCVIWGIPYLLIRVAVRELSPADLVFARTAIAAFLLLPLAARQGQLRLVLPHWRVLLLFAAVEIAVPWLMLSSAEKRLSSSLTGLLIAAVPLVSAVAVAALGSAHRLEGRQWFGLLVGLCGVAALVGLDFGRLGVGPLLEVCVVVVGYAAGPIILMRWLTDLPSLGVMAVALSATAVVYLPVAALELPTHLHVGVILAVVALAVVCTALAFVLFFELIALLGPVQASVITFINPAVAAILGVVALNERFTAGMGVGFALVLAGSVLATRPPRRRARVAIPEAAPS